MTPSSATEAGGRLLRVASDRAGISTTSTPIGVSTSRLHTRKGVEAEFDSAETPSRSRAPVRAVLPPSRLMSSARSSAPILARSGARTAAHDEDPS